MKKSLGKKLFVIGLTLIVLFVILNIALTYFCLIPFSTYLSQKQMEKFAIEIANKSDYANDEFMQVIEQYDEDENTQVTIIDRDKNIICTTRAASYRQHKLGKISDRLIDDNMNELEQGQPIFHTGNIEDSNRITVRVIKKVADNRYAIMFRSYRSLQSAMRAAITFEVIAGIILVLLGFVIVNLSSRKLIRPIREMTEIAESISNLQFDKKITVKNEDELGQLGVSINKMSNHLEANLDALQSDIENRKKLVRNLSHEIKSPVAVIMGYSERMKTLITKNPQRAEEYCDIIASESTRIDMLVKEMLEFSKLEQRTEDLYLEDIAVGTLFQNLQKQFSDENIDCELPLQTEYDEKDHIRVDYNLIERALRNLLRNALVHGSKENLVIRLSGKTVERFYEFTVFNTGDAIPSEKIECIWDAFVKVDLARTRGRQGSGVGLSIVREIVEAHGGYYRAENVNDGVAFTIAVKNE